MLQPILYVNKVTTRNVPLKEKEMLSDVTQLKRTYSVRKDSCSNLSLNEIKLQGLSRQLCITYQITAICSEFSFVQIQTTFGPQRLCLPVNDTLSSDSGGLRKAWGTGLSSIPGSHNGEQIFFLYPCLCSPQY